MFMNVAADASNLQEAITSIVIGKSSKYCCLEVSSRLTTLCSEPGVTVSASTLTSLRRFELAFGYCDYTLDGAPYYVGIGNVTRVRCLHRNNKKHTNVSNKHGQRRHIECVAIRSYDLLIEWEKQKIAEFGTYHYEHPDGLGSNFTTGGEGSPNHKQSTRIKSEEERHKISQSKILLYSDPYERKKLGDAIRRAKAEPEKLQRHAEAQQKRYSDPNERHKAHLTNTQRKCVQQLTHEGVIIAEFTSMSYAVQQTGITNIKQCCQGKRQFAGGFRWRYVV